MSVLHVCSTKILPKVFKYFEKGCTSVVQKFKKGTMTGRKLEEDDTDDGFQNKRLCTENSTIENAEEKKLRKKNVAILLSYCGANYYGMQINCGFKTIESELLSALEKSGVIPNVAVTDPYSIHFQRAARTDKGVSAKKQVVSFKAFIDNCKVESINSHLPEDIRVMSVKRVTKGFNSKNLCLARTYSYTLPTFALSPELHEEYPHNYRISDEAIEKVNQVLHTFQGTHCFHNFTSRKFSEDPSAKRYIMSFKTEPPFVDGEEFITLTVKGQSFMLHQIRKMVGYTIAILKGLMPKDIETKVWQKEKFSIPMAPGLGLVLENLHYDSYNRKFGNDGVHESLTWEEIEDEIEKFKNKHILSAIIKTEINEKSMFNWLKLLSDHRYEFSKETDVLEGELEAEAPSDINLDKQIQN